MAKVEKAMQPSLNEEIKLFVNRLKIIGIVAVVFIGAFYLATFIQSLAVSLTSSILPF